MIDIDKKNVVDVNYIARFSIPDSIDGNVLMTYSYPDIDLSNEDFFINNVKSFIPFILSRDRYNSLIIKVCLKTRK